MKKLDSLQMENLQGGKISCNSYQNKVMAIAGAAATAIGFAGPIGAIIAAPTAIGAGVYGLYCAYQ
ncbi:hypothetical protein AB2S32_12550 [Elizabethkingia anophelis]|uniref:hypothetical protein n=1 Tax=Elizabethkingia TaxID=308865 RepID=UPI000999AC44|nr:MULTISPECIES: hypothetical protein [Elizabethkingia]MCT3674374.1 hypothetical protein [Elizabethkingia anophelis]MCT3681859.1 hypothetical protein [Elizabethkingia anophelis]MCT3704330.1 hypothetical protein [Elizabethkingia anophelis]MCT3746817.1 hypothetical protein [Elizabethkingia anophelis]MCT3770522.1 hypothetical protein [Elizabethkingia anophelis]